LANNDKQAARAFHDATKLSYINLLTKPPLYKSYPGLTQIPLPEAAPPGMSTLEAISGAPSAEASDFDLAAVAQLLHFSAGLIRKKNLAAAGEVHYRAAASAGHSTPSNSTWSAATCRACRPASTTTPQPTTPLPS